VAISQATAIMGRFFQLIHQIVSNRHMEGVGQVTEEAILRYRVIQVCGFDTHDVTMTVANEGCLT
jgi:hypothetical protein